LNVSPNLKQEVRIFLHGYVGYLEAVKPQDLYISLVEKSKDLAELDDNVKKTTADVTTKGDSRLGETIKSLHERVRNNYF
jgi:hypothetical protein